MRGVVLKESIVKGYEGGGGERKGGDGSNGERSSVEKSRAGNGGVVRGREKLIADCSFDVGSQTVRQ